MSKARRQVRTPRPAARNIASLTCCNLYPDHLPLPCCSSTPSFHTSWPPIHHTRRPTAAGLPALLDVYRRHYFLPASEVPRSVAIADPSEYFVAQAVATAGGRLHCSALRFAGSTAWLLLLLGLVT